ncbi:MAG: NADH-quinone oxidoreductase subunit C [Actinomycetaceae bacterium]|nr:NADH-quinone oxidoreductase subunit C [Actinomycetaceae bacterium]
MSEVEEVQEAPEVQTPAIFGSYPQPELIREVRGMWGAKGSGDTSGFTGLEKTEEFARPAVAPYGGWFDDVVAALREDLESDGITDAIEKIVVENGQLVIFVKREHLRTVMQNLRDDQDLRFEMCLGVSAVHYPNSKGRELHGYYPLLSITHNRFIAVETTCPEEDPHLPSVVSIYPGNDWFECEAWDLMGIIFDEHPGLVRMAMPDDWVGHPQRKDYPLGGVPVDYKGAVTPPSDTRREYN